ncbi:hypothetical protein OR1_00730 [Geobacter sp. OR-1]|uniref:conjugal transfer protein TraF n=1 Tax=Geobacter sp. OR-1 TaxID=1266765 RepID=UPI0005444837|nr:conjugal transfer protein TraF [Geobacter sp. OR-1]GAM08458.1 hypothetical protein OR1_00730 [Geobacter sp. OR-1]
MKRSAVAATGLLLAISTTAVAAEFQPMGALGIGGAGVARTYDANAPYWNPAGLAFNEKDFSSRIDVSVGIKVNDGLADNVDRLDKINFDNIKQISGTTSLQNVTDTIKAITILNDIKAKKGTLGINGNTVLGFQYKHFATGAFGTIEGFAQPQPDTVNIVPQSGVNTPVTPTEFATPFAGSPASSVFFSANQRSTIDTALLANGFSAGQAQDIINGTDARLAGSGLSSQAVADTLINQVTTINSATAANLLENNTTSVLTRSLAYIEFPFSYGLPFNFGSWGVLGIGGTAKVIAGRVYQAQTFLLQDNKSVSSSDITKDMTKNFKDSVNASFDLGALWRYNKMLNIGIVAKNLTAPEFDAPDLKKKDGSFDRSGGKVKLAPQVRLGVAIDPYEWLTLAVDLDLTENETVLSADNFKNRHIGGGLEWHHFSWIKLRGGMYSNLSDGGIGPTATAGLTLGSKWFNMDVDGAYGLETAEYDGKSYPQEARVQLQLNLSF